ncbi:Serine protease easter [Frankliniella fusca]|uniref:limulus clotting factor C n=1 Tax=Frankliniella fusca TaxID=407009 RepID=A0AAE1GUF0_9NEOP|nr:Serine protease easter [Frankliniella fusca]
MAPTFSTAASALLAAMLALHAVSAADSTTGARKSTSNASAPSQESDPADGSGDRVAARQLFGFGPGNGPLGSLGSGFPFGGFGGVPGFGNNPFLNGQFGNGNQFNSGRPALGSGEVPSGGQFGSPALGGGGSGGEAPSGSQFNGGRPALGSGGGQGFGNNPFLNGQLNNNRPAVGNGQALNGNGNQFDAGSGEVQPANGNQFNNGGRPASGGRPVRPGGQAGQSRPVGVPTATTPPVPVNSGPQGRETLVNPSECGILSQDRIIGGNTTSVMELPWMARLGYTSRRGAISYRCGGSLINHRYVLTAAHCVGDGEDPVQVRLGEWDEDSERDCSLISGSNVCAPPVVDVRVERVIRHPQYSSDASSPNYLKNDVALLRLRSPVTFTEAVKPICLPEQGNVQVKTSTGSKAIVAGWGKDRNRGSTGTRFLMEASVPLWSVPECTRVYQSRGVRVGATQVCAGGTRGVDSCQGDSGGPLFRPGTVGDQTRAVQIGVVSFGLKDCATEGVPGVYTRVESHMPWIVSNLAP